MAAPEGGGAMGVPIVAPWGWFAQWAEERFSEASIIENADKFTRAALPGGVRYNNPIGVDEFDREAEGKAMAIPIIGVMGSGSLEHRDLAEPLGEWLAVQGYNLITGGGAGVMTAVSRAFSLVRDRRGVSIGVLPAGPPPGYPNPWVDVVIQTHLPKRGNEGSDILSRNHVTILSSAVVVVLPGREGTRTELALALHHRRPVIAYLGQDGEIQGTTRMALATAPGRAVAISLDEVKAFVHEHVGG
jgi:uncharacterized protein (TIGR00725 family)